MAKSNFSHRAIQTIYTGNKVMDSPLANIYMILNQIYNDLSKLNTSAYNNQIINNGGNESDPLSLHLDFWKLDCGVASSIYGQLMEIMLSHIFKCGAADHGDGSFDFIPSEVLDCGGA